MLSPFVILRNEVTKNLFSSLPSFCHSEEQSDEESVFYRYCEDPSLNAQDDTGRNSDRNLEFFLGHIRLCHSEERSDEESFLFRYCEDPSLTLRMTR